MGGEEVGRVDCGTPPLHFRAESTLSHMISYEDISAARVEKLGKVGFSQKAHF